MYSVKRNYAEENVSLWHSFTFLSRVISLLARQVEILAGTFFSFEQASKLHKDKAVAQI